VHYSAAPLGPLHAVEQSAEAENKPKGLWVSDDDEVENSWPVWCIGEGFHLDSLRYAYDVTLGKGFVGLRISTPEGVDMFTEEYAVSFEDRFGAEATAVGLRLPHLNSGMWIDWKRVAARYSGIICTPYLWSRRLGPMWYYGWDCASGCIWDVSKIESVTLRAKVTP
jgi:hypothetical protein